MFHHGGRKEQPCVEFALAATIVSGRERSLTAANRAAAADADAAVAVGGHSFQATILQATDRGIKRRAAALAAHERSLTQGRTNCPLTDDSDPTRRGSAALCVS